VDNKDAQSAQKSMNTVVTATFGYSTSPANSIQLIPSYNFYTNYNFNYLARDFNFMAHSPSLYVLYKPAARFSVGGKAQGTFVMKNDLAPGEDASRVKYRPFSLVGDIGPVAKYEVSPRLALAAEVYFRPKDYYQDPSGGDSRRSGQGIYAKLSGDLSTGLSWLNLLPYVSFEWDYPEGLLFRSYNYGGGIGDPIQLTDKFILTPYLDLLGSNYYAAVPPAFVKRDDFKFTSRLSALYTINSKWTALADLTYINNDSSIDTSYKYNRLLVSGGATYSF
jgi:hypothetical protein